VKSPTVEALPPRGGVEKGRECVEAYVQFVHYAERLYQDAVGGAAERTGVSRRVITSEDDQASG
jgi:hypothetical protein